MGPDTEPAQEFIAGEGTIGQERDHPESGQKLVYFHQQGDRNRGAYARTGSTGSARATKWPGHAPPLTNRSKAWWYPGPDERCGMVLTVLNRPENQRAVEGFHIDAAVVEPTLTAPLPAGDKKTGLAHQRSNQTVSLISNPATILARSTTWRWPRKGKNLSKSRRAQSCGGLVNPRATGLV